jgi:hypothetical protein
MKLRSLFFFVALFLSLSPARAYGPDGHKIIGAIADQRLAGTPTGARVSQLLDGYSLEEASIMADTIKQWDKPGIDDPKVQKYFSSHPKIAAQLREFWKANPPTEDEKSEIPSHHWFHYTDVPLVGDEKYGDGKAGRSQWDIVHMMRYCIGVLEGKIPPTNERKITKPIALILLAHFVGDIHQPLHVGAQYFDAEGKPVNPGHVPSALPDEGGNSLQLKLADAAPRRHNPKFHGFWDLDAVMANLPVLPDTMPKEMRQEKMNLAEKSLTSRLAKAEPKNWQMPASMPVEDYPEAWANEILPIAREAHSRLHYEHIQPTEDHGQTVAGGEIVETAGDKGESYREWAAHRVLAEMQKAGWRLADLLQKLLAPNDEHPAAGS